MTFAVAFIHGYNKTPNTWNTTEFGKNINIETMIATKAETLLIAIDFDADPKQAIIPILTEMKSKNKKWIIVCHSLGVVYGLELLNYDINIHAVCLIDPTPLDDIYIKESLITHSHISKYCSNLGKIDYPAKIIFHIHLDYNSDELHILKQKTEFYKNLIGKNNRSAMFIHPGKGHMIHYTASPKIIESIMSLIK